MFEEISFDVAVIIQTKKTIERDKTLENKRFNSHGYQIAY